MTDPEETKTLTKKQLDDWLASVTRYGSDPKIIWVFDPKVYDILKNLPDK